MVQALAGTILGSLGSQSRNPLVNQSPRLDTSTSAIAGSQSNKIAKRAERNADKERLYSLITDPMVSSLLTLLVGIYLAEHIPWSDDAKRRSLLRGLALSGVTLTSMGRAGVGDLTTLGMSGIAGIAGLSGEDGLNPVEESKSFIEKFFPYSPQGLLLDLFK